MNFDEIVREFVEENVDTIKAILGRLLLDASSGDSEAIDMVVRYFISPMVFKRSDDVLEPKSLHNVEELMKPSLREKQYCQTMFALKEYLSTRQEMSDMYNVVKNYFKKVDDLEKANKCNNLVLIKNKRKSYH